MPASLNRYQLIMLRGQYQHYQSYRLRLNQAHTKPERLLAAVEVAEAREQYNAVAYGTDPSAFALTDLPNRLSEK